MPDTPFSHRSARVNLPEVTARLYLMDRQPPADDLVSTHLDRWANNEDSNLLVLYGPLGAGKTSAIQKWIYSETVSSPADKVESVEYLSLGSASTQELLKAPQARMKFVILDDFDTVSTAGKSGFLTPDLSLVRPLFEAHKRVILVTRRNPFQKVDEFTQQLNSEMRLSTLLADNLWIVGIKPFDLDVLTRQADGGSDDRLRRVVATLAETDERERQFLLRPLLIDQLYELAKSERKLPETFTETYSRFIDYAMAVDYDRGTTRIPGRVRGNITRALAWDIFSGVESGPEWASGPLEISFDRVAEQVMEGIQSDPALRLARDFDRYEWTYDFLVPSHIFGPSDASLNITPDINRFFSFTHTSFYEYLAAYGIWTRLSNARPLDLDSSRVAEATFDSAIMTFLKAHLPGTNMEPLRVLARREHLPWMDRLVVLYLLEDDPQLEHALTQAPDGYWVHLESHYSQTQSFFLKKAILYQLVLAGKRDASTYISLLEGERDQDARLEAALLHVNGDHTSFLLARLRNPALSRALAITVFRLGQLGNRRAIPDLSALGRGHPELSGPCFDAINQISERANG